MENIKKMIDEYLKSVASDNINDEFKKIIIETKKRAEWYKEGSCYKCGGEVKPNNAGIWSNFTCLKCGNSLYTDAIDYYYYNPIIKKIRELKI